MLVFSNRTILDKVIKDRKAGDVSQGILVDELELYLTRDSGKIFIESNAIRADIMSRTLMEIGVSDLNLDEAAMKLFGNSFLMVKFFQELAVEFVTLDSISHHDLYKSYTKHIHILKDVLEQYETYLSLYNAEDMITLPMKFFNADITPKGIEYLNGIDKLEVFYDGVLSRFDYILLKKAALHTKVSLFVKTDEYYTKTIERISVEAEDMEILPNSIYQIDLDTGASFIQDMGAKKNAKITLNSVTLGTSYSAYVDTLVGKALKQGVLASEIAVVCMSDEELGMLSFGKSQYAFNSCLPIEKTLIYKHLKNILLSLNGEDEHKRVANLVLNRLYSQGILEKESFSNLAAVWIDGISFEQFEAIMNTLVEHYSFNEILAFNKALKKIGFYANMVGHKTVSELFELLIFEFSFQEVEPSHNSINVYDFSGLRGLSAKLLIVLGFERQKFPAAAKKDLFLDSSVRLDSGMPIYKDRADLQKHYLLTLMDRCASLDGEVYFCFKDSSNSTVSPFLAEIGIHKVKSINEKKLVKKFIAQAIVNNDINFFSTGNKIEAEVSENRTLSASKLNTYLSCKRKYYYQYIKGISEQVDSGLRIIDKDFGIAVHNAVSKVLTPGYIPTSKADLKDNLIQAVKLEIGTHNAAVDFNFEMWMRNLNVFVDDEFNRLSLGLRSIETVEQLFSGELFGMKITGRPDRVDVLENGVVSIIDYKTGKTPDLSVSGKGETDFQPEFMKFLIEKAYNGDNGGVTTEFLYRNLRTGKETKAVSSIERDAAFLAAVEDFVRDDGVYAMTHTRSTCKFCPFAKICGR